MTWFDWPSSNGPCQTKSSESIFIEKTEECSSFKENILR